MRTVRLTFIAAVVALLQACVSVDAPEQTQNEKASAVNVQLGIGYLQQENLDLASEKLSRALSQDPKSASAHNAFAILQERLLQNEKAEFHYRQATTLDPEDSQAANNYGAFLCRNGREAESEQYFVRASDNPLYRTPEVAYTNAAFCLLKIDEREKAKDYLRRALAAKSDFRQALFAMADLLFEDQDHANARRHLERYHLTGRPTAASLWLAIRNEIELGGLGSGTVDRFGRELQEKFADSEEFRSWQKIQ